MATEDNNKPQKENFNEHANIEFKQHQDFYGDMYEYKRSFEINFAEFYTSQKHGILAFKDLTKLITATSAQLKKRLDLHIIETKKLAIMNELDTANWVEARNLIYALSQEINSTFEELGLTPQVKEEEFENSKWWKEEEHKGMKEIKKAFYDVLVINNG